MGELSRAERERERQTERERKRRHMPFRFGSSRVQECDSLLVLLVLLLAEWLALLHIDIV